MKNIPSADKMAQNCKSVFWIWKEIYLWTIYLGQAPPTLAVNGSKMTSKCAVWPASMQMMWWIVHFAAKTSHCIQKQNLFNPKIWSVNAETVNFGSYEKQLATFYFINHRKLCFCYFCSSSYSASVKHVWFLGTCEKYLAIFISLMQPLFWCHTLLSTELPFPAQFSLKFSIGNTCWCSTFLF